MLLNFNSNCGGLYVNRELFFRSETFFEGFPIQEYHLPYKAQVLYHFSICPQQIIIG